MIKLTIKQFKKKLIRGLANPELFKLPVKDETKKSQQLTIRTILYNTLNLETMEYSNSNGYNLTGVLSHIVMFDANGNIYFNSKQEQTNPSAFFILKNVPYGSYKVKVIYCESCGIVDNEIHSFTVENDNVEFNISLKYRWNTEIAHMEKGQIDYYVNGNNYEISNVNIPSYWSYIDIIDEKDNSLLCTVPYRNNLRRMFSLSHESHSYDTTHINIYTNKVCDYFSLSYKYDYNSALVDNSSGQGVILAESVDSAYCSFVNSETISTKCLTMFNGLYKDFEIIKPQGYNDCFSCRIKHIVCNEDRKYYNHVSGQIISESTVEDNGYMYNTGYYADSSSYDTINNTMDFSSFINDALVYYKNYLYSDAEINENFFKANNYVIFPVKGFRGRNMYSSVNTWKDYLDIMEKYKDDESFSITKCARYDIDKYYFNSGISPDYFGVYSGLYNYRNGYFNFILPEDQTICLFGNNNRILGYVRYGEDTIDASIRHVINDKIPSYSDDYDQY